VRTSENSVKTKFAEFFFHAIGKHTKLRADVSRETSGEEDEPKPVTVEVPANEAAEAARPDRSGRQRAD
jgi:hypothetical protein